MTQNSFGNDTFKTQSVEHMFQQGTPLNSSTISKNALSWYTRDGRQPTKSLLNEEESLFKEHLDFLAKKTTQNVQALSEMEFKVSFLSVTSDMKKELNIPKQPLIRFSNLNGMPPQLGENIRNLKFDYMTPIQKVVIPYMQNGKDVVGCSETGSGKTIAYLFPLIGNMLVKGTPSNPFLSQKRDIAYPLSLVLVPTRELAEQVYKESKKLCYKTGINTVKVYGGVPAYEQIRALQEGCDILIATPGRLKDHIQKGRISLKMISTLILDEADRMLDMGFSQDLKEIVSGYDMPDKGRRQNLMFSATFDDEIKEIAKQFLKDYFFVQPKNQAPKQIVQEIIKADDGQKPRILCDILRKLQGSAIIFMDTKKGVDELAYNLNNEHFSVVSIHGDRNQFQRQYAITNFASGKIPVLIATDVAARGLDFPNVSTVINYEMPKNIDDYIHRIGRTGRIGQVGRAVSFLNYQCKMIYGKLYKLLKSQRQVIPDWFEKECQEIGDLGFKRTMNWNTGRSSNNGGGSWDNNNNSNNWSSGGNDSCNNNNTQWSSNSNPGSNNNITSWSSKDQGNNGGWNNSPRRNSDEVEDINNFKRNRSRSRSNSRHRATEPNPNWNKKENVNWNGQPSNEPQSSW